MTAQFRRGLVVGKFCPLHRGHEYLIDEAMNACDEVVIVSYTKPEFERCFPPARERWLAARFPSAVRRVVDDRAVAALCAHERIPVRTVPHNDAPPSEHREFVAWLCWQHAGGPVDAVFTSESYGDGFAEALTEYFRARTADAAAVKHVCVDEPRTGIPVSATRIRADPHGHRQFLSPEVYSDFVERVCILGGESSGKSTLARLLAEHLDTVWAHEYGRELTERRQLNFADLLRIGHVQVAREKRLSRHAKRWLFCDSSPLTTLFYSLEMFGRADPRLERLAQREYDRVLLCAPDFAFVQDGTRRDERFRQAQHEWYVRELDERRIAYTLLSGPIEARLAAGIALLMPATAGGDPATAITLSSPPKS